MRPFLGHSVLEFLMDSNQKEMEKAEHEHKHFVEIVNGSSVLPDTIFKKLLHFKNFQYKLGSHVGEISDNSNTVSVSVTDKDGLKTITADFVIVTPTAREIDQMKFSPPLPYMKKHALDGLEYFGSVKILLKFKSPFWADKNSIPSIKYGDKNSVNGASAVSDDILRMVSTSLLIQNGRYNLGLSVGVKNGDLSEVWNYPQGQYGISGIQFFLFFFVTIYIY